MMKSEFLELTSQKGTMINNDIYNAIERLYLSDNDYHKENGSINETKQDFCKRVFVTTQNTEKTLLERLIAEIVKENNFFICDKTKQDLHEMKIKEHYTSIAKW